MRQSDKLGSHPLVVIISLVASIIGIWVYLSGNQSIRELFSSEPSNISLAQTQIPTIIPTATQPLLIFGNAIWDVSPKGLSYSFEKEAIATLENHIPSDIKIELDPWHVGDFKVILTASKYWYMGNVPLDEIDDPEIGKTNCFVFLVNPSGTCSFAPGESYVIKTYNGYLLKFRIVSADYYLDTNTNYYNQVYYVEWILRPFKTNKFSHQ